MPLRTRVAFAADLITLLSVLALGGCGTASHIKVCNATSQCCGPSDLCPAIAHLYALGLDGTISVFPINGSTPGSPTSISGPAMSLGMAALNNEFLYVSNPQLSIDGASSIDAWSFVGDGTLSPVPGSPFSLGTLSFAGGLAVDSSAQVVYVGDAGRIDALVADATGALSDVTGSPFPGGSNLFLTVDLQNRFLFATDDSPPGNVWAYSISASTGALSVAPGSPYPTIPGYVGTTQPSGIVVDGSGSFVYASLLNANAVAAFSIAPSTGALTAVVGSPFPAGNSPLALAVARNFLYVSNADGTLSAYSIDPTSGALTPLAGSPFAVHAGTLVTAPDENVLYTAGSAGLEAFTIDSSTGALTQVGSTIPYGGATVLTYVQ